jgi:UDP-N-acetylglucosamine 3-dehydrogenase
MKEQHFKIAVIGAGIHAETNIFPSLANHLLADVNKVAVCDLDEKKARRMAAVSAAPLTFTDYRRMIGECKPDGVIVCLNARLHPEVVIGCLELGVPVLVEKAPAETVEQAVAMREAARKNGKVVMIAHQKRHSTAYSQARQIVADQASFGRIVQLEAKMHGMGVFPNNFSCLMEWQIHNIDLIRWFGGDLADIKVQATVHGENRASVVIALKFQGGAVGAVAWGTYGGPGPFCERLEVISDKDKGIIVENAYDTIEYEGSWGRRWRPDWNPNLGNQSQALMGYVGEIHHFIEAVRGNAQPSPSIDDGVKNLEALYEIARQMGIPTEWKFTPSKF